MALCRYSLLAQSISTALFLVIILKFCPFIILKFCLFIIYDNYTSFLTRIPPFKQTKHHESR